MLYVYAFIVKSCLTKRQKKQQQKNNKKQQTNKQQKSNVTATDKSSTFPPV
jgi:PBP1b-binding outer membrane lipoprotein LpoB